MPSGIRSWLLKLGKSTKFGTLMWVMHEEKRTATCVRFLEYQKGWWR